LIGRCVDRQQRVIGDAQTPCRGERQQRLTAAGTGAGEQGPHFDAVQRGDEAACLPVPEGAQRTVGITAVPALLLARVRVTDQDEHAHPLGHPAIRWPVLGDHRRRFAPVMIVRHRFDAQESSNLVTASSDSAW
jgi:hypothetical protein